MKSKILIGTILSLTLTFSFKAFSQTQSMVCSNPLKAICGGQVALKARAAKEASIESLKKEISSEANTNTKKIITELKKNPKFIENNGTKDLIKKIRHEQIMKSAKARMNQIETVVTNSSIISYLKIFLKIAIDESSLNKVTKNDYKNIVDSVIIGNFSDFITRTKLEKNTFEELESRCGLDGMEKEAFALMMNGQRYVLICPGMQITTYKTPNMQQRINNILFVLTHEMSHHIDESAPGVGSEPYGPFLECAFYNYSKNLKKTEEIYDFCKFNPGQACNFEVVMSHAGEMIADLWANKVMAIYARGNQYSIYQTDLLLMSSHRALCGLQADGVHPSGHFRIGTMLRLAPEIYNYLGCDNSNTMKNRTCTLEGEVKL